MNFKGLSRSLRVKIMLIVLSIVVFSIGIVTVISIYSMQAQMERQITEKQMLLAESFAEFVQQFFNDAAGMVKAAARLPDVRNMVLSSSLISEDYKGVSEGMDFIKRETLRNLINDYGNFSYMQLVIPSGINMLIEPYEYQSNLREMDMSNYDWFKGAVSKMDSHISEVFLCPSMQQPVVAFSHPLTNDIDGQLVGVLMGAMTLERLNNLCAELTFGETGYAYLVDQRGACAAHLDEQLTSNITSLVDIPMVQKVMARESGVGRYYDPKSGKEIFSAFQPIGETGWGLIVVQDLEEAFAPVRETRTIILVVALLLLATFVGVAIVVANSITRPINLLVGEVKKMSEGDLTGEIKISSQDEIGNLARHFNRMIANINTDLLNINAAAEQVAAGANQLAGSSQSLSQGATEQASSIQEITATITEIANQTKENAHHAGQANELTLQAMELAEQGNRQMQEMVKAMSDINDSAGNISKVIKAIDDLAFQTNILALNAAVEAARAGQHGRGFAVVAEEVRNLAARSANAAHETTGMIEDSILKAETGMKIAVETAEELNKIEQAVNEAAALVAKIASASNEQAAEITQINQAIDQVSQVVQNNSAMAEETASASEELSSQAELMKNAIRKFKLKKGTYSYGNANVFALETDRQHEELPETESFYPFYRPEEIMGEAPEADGDNSPGSPGRSEGHYGKY